MTALTADKPRPFELGDINALLVKASTTIFEGCAVGDASGYARKLNSGDPFRGFAEAKADNSAGADGDKSVRVRRKGAVQLAVTSAAITDVGRPVYASDDNAFSMDGSGTYVGRIIRYVSSGVAIVYFDADVPESVDIVVIPVTLAGVTAADVVTNYTPGFAGRVKKWDAVVTVPVTTGSKLATLNLEINTTNATGGTIALTSANCATLGAIVAQGSALSAGNAFDADDTLSVEAASVTAFVEGAVALVLQLGK